MDFRQQMPGGMFPPQMQQPQQFPQGGPQQESLFFPGGGFPGGGFPGGGFPGGGSGLNQRVTSLERRVQRLERENNQLNRRLSRLERQLGQSGRPDDPYQEYY